MPYIPDDAMPYIPDDAMPYMPDDAMPNILTFQIQYQTPQHMMNGK